MKHHKNRLLLTVALIPFSLSAQVVRKYPAKGNLIKYFPYATVQVIDNRLDITRIYTRETGVYPPHHVNFSEPASKNIPIEQINVNVRNRWKDCKVITETNDCTLDMNTGDILFNDK